MKADQNITKMNERKTVEFLPGIFRTTMSFNDQSVLCHFCMNKGANIPLHHHVAVQNGYVLKGKAMFSKADGNTFVVEKGDGYIFGSNEPHSAEILEDTGLIEYFTPMGFEYIDK